jgi:hypothetical protein
VLALFAVVLAGAVLPLFAAPNPPLHDYPGHLARAWILAHLDGVPELRAFYAPASWWLPNLGMDATMQALASALPVPVAGRVFVGLILALQLGGIAFLHRVWFGAASPWPLLLGGVLLYNWILLLGFLGYLLGVALLPWAFGAWLLLRRRRPAARLAGGLALALLLFFTHLVAFGLYAVLVAAWELRSAARAPGRAAAIDALRAAAPLAAAAALFAASPMAASVSGRWTYHPDWTWKPVILLRALQSGQPAADAAAAVALVAAAALLVWRGRLELAPGAGLPLLALLAAYLALPMPLLGSFFADARLPVALATIASAAVRPRLRDRRAAAALAALLAVLLAVRAAVFTRAWSRHAAVLAEFDSAFDALPPGAVLYLANAYPPDEVPSLGSELLRPPRHGYWQPPLKHVGSLAVLHRPVFVPATWANPAHFPLRVTSPYLPVYRLQKEGPFQVTSPRQLARAAERIQALHAAASAPLGPPYLLVVSAGPRLDPPPGARVAAAGSRFDLLELPPAPRLR